MEIKMDADWMASIASVAIFEQMSQEHRDSVMKQALEALLLPGKEPRTYNFGKTPLQVAFEGAIQTAATKAVHEMIANDPDISAKVKELLGPLIMAAVKVTAENYDYAFSDKLGTALGQWLHEQAQK